MIGEVHVEADFSKIDCETFTYQSHDPDESRFVADLELQLTKVIHPLQTVSSFLPRVDGIIEQVV